MRAPAWVCLLALLAGCGAATDPEPAPTTTPAPPEPTPWAREGPGDGSNFITCARRDNDDGRRVLPFTSISDTGVANEAHRLLERADRGDHQETWTARDVRTFLEALHRDWENANPGAPRESRSNPILVEDHGVLYMFAWSAVVAS